MKTIENQGLLQKRVDSEEPQINPDKRIGKVIQLRRENLRLSQDILSKQLLVGQRTLSRIELGKRSLKACEVKLFAQVLKIQESELL